MVEGYTKTVLTMIAASLFILAVQHAIEPTGGAAASRAGRPSFHALN
jgi:hypothetical protein